VACPPPRAPPITHQGDYEYFLSKNEDEADKMAVKEAKAAAIEKSGIKAKSKMTKAEKEKLKKEKAKVGGAAGPCRARALIWRRRWRGGV
jgi:hypothetical protein